MSTTKQRSNRVGAVRPSQLMYAYGVGALVDLPNLSVIVAGLEDWERQIQHQPQILEPRLLGAVRAALGSQVQELRGAPWTEETRHVFDEWARIGVPVLPFPRWLRCPATGCHRLAPIDDKAFTLEVPPSRPDRARYVHTNCRGKNVKRSPTALPARFVVACPAGHLDEFPWVEFCHAEKGMCAAPVLQLVEIGNGTRSTDMLVSCQCDAKMSVAAAFGTARDRYLPACRGRHPHLRRFDTVECKQATSALLLGASNAWFPIMQTALSIPSSEDALGSLLDDVWQDIYDIETPGELERAIRRNRAALGALEDFGVEAVFAEIERRQKDGAGTAMPEEADLKGPEWTRLIDPDHAPTSRDFLITGEPVPARLRDGVAQVVLAERLREVVALTGFARVEGPDSGVSGDQEITHAAPISRAKVPAWVPAAEIRGEGVFLQLDEERVSEWESRVGGTPRMDALISAAIRWRTARGLDPSVVPPARFYLVHSLAHALINAFAVECGYSAASIRERIYARLPSGEAPAMAGVLLYTGAPDSEGTLGGLVELGRSESLGRLVAAALGRAELCASDPLCADHVPSADPQAPMHGAACHACLFVPETSCECGNRYLDRSLLVPTVADGSVAYFLRGR